MADADETVREDVKKEAAQELRNSTRQYASRASRCLGWYLPPTRLAVKQLKGIEPSNAERRSNRYILMGLWLAMPSHKRLYV
jgi:hypothetical protein